MQGRIISAILAAGVLFFITSGCKSTKFAQLEGVKQDLISVDESDSMALVRAGYVYRANRFKRFWLGDHYRDVWTAPVVAPIINMEREKGGLKILGKGGGMQTKSLKLKSENNRLYSLRSIQKDPSGVLPEILRKTVVDDLIQDQISAEHPYGAMVLPPLAEAAQLYYPTPELVYVTESALPEEYRDTFGGMLAYLEEDADENWEDEKSFGYTKNAVSTESVLEEITEDNDSRIDEVQLLRSRLFDMWIGDWDRHGGQWRWAEFDDPDGSGNIYKPIPEDRDNVFFKFDGFIPWWASRKWAERKFQTFDEDIRDIKGLNYNARFFDRRFLSGLNWDEWQQQIELLQKNLTDEVIEKAIGNFPDTVYQLTGPEIIHKLKVRRGRMERFAKDYYNFLAENITIEGSDDDEYFLVERLDNSQTRVRVYEKDDDEKKQRLFYDRTFYTDLTKELVLHGLGGDDYFEISGEVDKGIRVRAIGGWGEDTFIDQSKVSGLRNMTHLYDTEITNHQLEGFPFAGASENHFQVSREAKKHVTTDLNVNRYDYGNFEYDLLAPQVMLGFNTDDGVFIGGGILIRKNGFRKSPYKSQHRISGNIATETAAWNLIYKGEFVDILGDLDLVLDLNSQAPNFRTNFFGLGNETSNVAEDDDFHNFRFDRIIFNAGLRVNYGNNNSILFGPLVRLEDVERQNGLFITSPEANLGPSAFDTKVFSGFKFVSNIRTTTDENHPQRGVQWLTDLSWNYGLGDEDKRFSQISSELNVYYTFYTFLDITFAASFGTASNIGEFNFFQANTLGGNRGFGRPGNLRGFLRDRFSGRSSAYQNTDLRIKLTEFRFYILPFSLGILGHVDHGRVWIDDENSDTWHSSYGGGFWIRPVAKWVLTGTFSTSDEENLFNLQLGFNF